MSVQEQGRAALVGVAAGAATLGVAELGAGVAVRLLGATGTPSPLLAVAGAFVDRTPAWLKDWAVATFGTADKIALGVGMGLVLVVVTALVGVLGRTSRALAFGLFLLVGALGLGAVLSRPGAMPADLWPTLAGLAVGTAVLVVGLGRLGTIPEEPGQTGPVTGRRQVVLAAGGIGVLGVLGVVAGQALTRTGRAAGATVRALGLPVPVRRVQIPAAALASVEGQSPFVTPTEEFYRIDTALWVPRVDPATWTLRVTGLVEQEVEIDWAELLEQDHVESIVTLTCVSNTVGGPLVGNTVWTGWPVRELLARAGVLPEADMVLSRSADGWTAGTPIEALTDDRDALIAVAMDGEPLPPEHGYPVRLVVPGLYGYVSATKWVTELKVTRFDADEGYWTPRGWAERGPVKTASRIDVPRSEARVRAGEVVVAGVAWAQQRGVDAVEVRVDDGPWQQAELAAEPSIDAWRLWSWTWPDAATGRHQLTVRATDGTGETQTDTPAAPAPDGASGWHAVEVTVVEDD
ncbi:molybdopterin-dependent oxidoreductase [uncultured Ornithinimicrobium sp.]|uniref:molybdopterin-dependent oxidoreductase n=1 Tax=uncultured Ornithinimicrobium sp. TaxID=259307 RepID=UPI002595899A|nr:molybdopterin-dependent oxidoreductase [uncultured Ornithinimicrobium sp.]